MEIDAARVIRDITNTPIFVPEGNGKINLCKAVQDMIYEREELAEIRTLVKQIRKGRLTIEQPAFPMSTRHIYTVHNKNTSKGATK